MRLRSSMEGFLAGPHGSFFDYLFSFHVLPFTASITLAAAMRACMISPGWSALVLCGGLITSASLFVILPLPILGPVGGHFNVGVRYFDGHRSQSIPPLVVFYPTNESPLSKGVQYLPYSDIRFINGLSDYVKLPRFIFRDEAFVRIKVLPNATPVTLAQQDHLHLPVLVFSHGLAAFHQLYSCLLTDIAARGIIVVAIGHCDGSASFMRDSGSEDNEIFFKPLSFEVAAREPQIVQRVRETRQTLQRITQQEFWYEVGFGEKEVHDFLAQNPKVHLSGHSFGGATVLITALQEETRESKNIASVTAFDPWFLMLQEKHFLEPIQTGDKEYTTPTLMLHSEQWVKDKESWDFFKRASDVVLSQPAVANMNEAKKPYVFVTERNGGPTHHSVTDVSMLSPIFHGGVNNIVPPRAQIVDLANSIVRFVKRNH